MSIAIERKLRPNIYLLAAGDIRALTQLILVILLLPIGALAHSDQRVDCLNNLRQLDGSKDLLALENKLKPGEPVEPEMLIPYILEGTIPQCRAGGRYTVGPIGICPVCSLPGHSEAEFRRDVERQARHERILFWLLIGGGSLAAAWVILAILAARGSSRRAARKSRQRMAAHTVSSWFWIILSFLTARRVPSAAIGSLNR